MTGRERFVCALHRKPADATPVWFMRQAGRFLPEYRALRERYDFLTSCHEPDLIVEITLQPLKRLDVDAAIVFSDILLPLEYMGVKFDIVENRGPVIESPIRTPEDVEKIHSFNPAEQMNFLGEALKHLRQELGDEKALLGFTGAPFTLASYLIEGGHSRDHALTKKFMYQNPQAWEKLMKKLTDVISKYVEFQATCGVDAVQIFDSWAGFLAPDDYEEFVKPYMEKIFSHSPVPTINFSTGTGGYIETIASSGGDVIGVDWRIRLNDAWQRVGPDKGIQGNLDPAAMLAEKRTLEARVKRILHQANGRPGHIFNLGHGILPTTPVENAQFVVELVHQLTSGK